MFNSIAELISLSEEKNITISEVMLRQEMELKSLSREEARSIMEKSLDVMEEAIDKAFRGVTSFTGLTGGDAPLLRKYIDSGKGLSGSTTLECIARAIGTNEVNAAMGVICATPTAGSAGTISGVLFGIKDKLKLSRDDMIDFLFCCGAIGLVLANKAGISGAVGGCQAEIGSSSAMAAAALVQISGGTPEQSANAVAIALKNMLGLVCDPVAGLVEVPCVKRNAAGASNALIAADMALANIKSRIPADDVIEAMRNIGKNMPSELRETGAGGLADTPTGKILAKKILEKSN